MYSKLGPILSAALDHMSTGVVLMTADCSMLYANRSATEMIEAGWPIRIANNIVQGRERHVTEALLNGVKLITEEKHGQDPDMRFDICLSCSSGRKEAVLGSLKPVSIGFGGELSEAFVCLYLTSRPPNAHAALGCIASTFGLTAAEKRVLGALELYGAVPAVAAALKLSENTVKTHLQNIFTKTGTARQTQLLRVISGLRPPLREGNGRAVEFKAPPTGRKTSARTAVEASMQHPSQAENAPIYA